MYGRQGAPFQQGWGPGSVVCFMVIWGWKLRSVLKAAEKKAIQKTHSESTSSEGRTPAYGTIDWFGVHQDWKEQRNTGYPWLECGPQVGVTGFGARRNTERGWGRCGTSNGCRGDISIATKADRYGMLWGWRIDGDRARNDMGHGARSHMGEVLSSREDQPVTLNVQIFRPSEKPGERQRAWLITGELSDLT